MFERHLKYFKNNGWKFIKMSELQLYENDNKVVAITFDDGYLDNYTNALPLLKNIMPALLCIWLLIDIKMIGL